MSVSVESVSTSMEGVRPRADTLGRWETRTIAITQRISFIGVLAMLGVGILNALDVLILRALFKAPITGSNEVFATVFATAIAAVLAGGLADRTTLEIDLLEKWLSARTVAVLRAIGAALYFIVILAIAWRVMIYSYEAFRAGRQTMLLQWKLWPFYFAISALFMICVPIQLLTFLRLARETMTSPSPQAVWLRTIGLFLLAVAITAAVWFTVQAFQPRIAANAAAWAVTLFLLLWAIALLFIPIAAALAICGIVGAAGLLGTTQALNVLGSETMGLITSEELAVIPLFLMMGGFAVAGGIAHDMYRLAHAIFAPLRGGLALATIAGCAGFGSVTGSSLATIATIGPAAYPEMKSRGYSPELSTGCLAAGGTLGVLIPPSTVIVLYALLVEQSIGMLYIALLVPGLLTMLFYMGAIGVTVWRNPAAAPAVGSWDLAEVLDAARACIPAFVLFLIVFGGMFFGIFTATEAAAVGAVISFLIALMRGKLRRGALWPVTVDTTRSASMLYFVVIGAFVVTFFMATSGMPETLTRQLAESGLPALAIVTIIAVVYIVLGTAMDTITIMLITAPILAGLIKSLGYDPIWWGIMTVMLVEIGVVSPPFGLNLFIMKTIAPDVSLNAVFRGVMPFMLADILKVAVLILFPVITLWLPRLAAIK
jgi:C4-dicarboxylate transporter, DctM subunit